MARGPHDDEDPPSGESPELDDAGAGHVGRAGEDEPADRPDGAPEPGAPGRDEPPPLPDVDERWRQIVAELGEIDPPDGDLAPDDDPGRGRADRPERVGGEASSGHRTWSPDPDAEEADEHFEPPEPPGILGGDPLLTMAWSAVVAAAVLFLLAAVAWRTMPTLLLRGAGLAFVAGVGLLLWRMPHHRDDDSGPGAVV